MKIVLLVGFYCLILSSFVTSFVTEAAKQEIDADLKARLEIAENWLDVRTQSEGIPAVSALIVQDQNVVWQYTTGAPWYLEDKHASSKFRICSISKLFTAVSIMQLVEQDQVDLEEDITAYLPWLSELQQGNDFAKPDVKSLLMHASGLPAEAPIPYFVEIDYPSKAEFVDSVAKTRLDHEPYTEHSYSNLGYSLLGEIISSVSGKSFQKYIQDHILIPLKMNESDVDAVTKTDQAGLISGYTISGENGRRKVFAPYSFNAIAPAGGFVSTTDDLAKLASWMFRTLDGKDQTLLKPETLKEMQRVQWSDKNRSGSIRGLGFGYYDHAGTTFVGHGGYCNGYRSIMLTEPESKVAVIVLINVNDASPYDIAYQLYEFFKKNPSAPIEENITPQLKKKLASFVGVYDRSGMPERVIISSNGQELLVADLFGNSAQIERLKWIEKNSFKVTAGSRKGETVRFENENVDGMENETTKFWRYPEFHYLIRTKSSDMAE